MGNARRGEVDLELGGESLTLVFDFNAISEIESQFGDRPINELLSSASGSIPMRVVRESLRIGLDRRNRKRTSKQVGTLIGDELQSDPAALPRIIMATAGGVAGAFGRSADDGDKPQEADDPDKPRPPQAPATGGG